MSKHLPPIHPGEILREDLLEPLGLSVNQLAMALSGDTPRLNEIVRGRRGITVSPPIRRFAWAAISEQPRSSG